MSVAPPFKRAAAAALIALVTLCPTVASADLVMSTVSLTSEDFQLAAAWSEVIAHNDPNLRITPVASGTVKGLRSLAKGRSDLSLIGAPHYLDATAHQGSFKEDPPGMVDDYKKLNALFAINTGMGQYLVRADSPIHTLADLKGRRISIGRPGGNAGRVSLSLFKVYGVDAAAGDIQVEYLDYGMSLDRLANGQIDATLVWGSLPQSGVDQASRSTRLRFISPQADSLPAFQAAIENGSQYSYRTIPAAQVRAAYGDRVESDGDVNFWTFPFMLMARADMPETTAYKLCKTFWMNVEKIRGSSPALSHLNIADSTRGLSAALHPGARRCLTELGAP